MTSVISALLNGGVWHATSPEDYLSILKDGVIFPQSANTKIGNSYSYVRTLNAVSLFDFTQIDPERYVVEVPGNSLAMFLTRKPYVWIEINPDLIAANCIFGIDLLEKWKSENASSRIMAQIEAAHIGPIPRAAFKRAFLVSEDGNITFIDI